MKAPLYNEILKLSQEIANASSADDTNLRLEACKQLQKLCATNQESPKDHPLQWETLADFTDDGDQAIEIYQIGLNLAEKLSLNEYSASIQLAMAERYQEFGEIPKAIELAEQANEVAKTITSEELKKEISELLANLNNISE